MQTTTTINEKTADRSTDCDHDWCDGPDSDTLPCFACFEVPSADDQPNSPDEQCGRAP